MHTDQMGQQYGTFQKNLRRNLMQSARSSKKGTFPVAHRNSKSQR